MSQQDPHKVISALDQEIVVMTLTTLVRLFELDSDAACLYLFYCKTAKLQSRQIGYTNKIKATTQYCLKGLVWGRDRFDNARKILEANDMVKLESKRDQNGAIAGWYIQINFLPKPYTDSYSPDASKPTSGQAPSQMHRNPHVVFDPPNAVNEKISAVNENMVDKSHSISLIPQHDPSPSKKGNEHILSSDEKKSYSTKTYSSKEYKALIRGVAGAQGLRTFPNYGKQMKFAKLLFVEAGATVEEVIYAAQRMTEDIFWKDKTFDVGNVYNNYHRYQSEKQLTAEEQELQKALHPYENQELIELVHRLAEGGLL